MTSTRRSFGTQFRRLFGLAHFIQQSSVFIEDGRQSSLIARPKHSLEDDRQHSKIAANDRIGCQGGGSLPRKSFMARSTSASLERNT